MGIPWGSFVKKILFFLCSDQLTESNCLWFQTLLTRHSKHSWGPPSFQAEVPCRLQNSHALLKGSGDKSSLSLTTFHGSPWALYIFASSMLPSGGSKWRFGKLIIFLTRSQGNTPSLLKLWGVSFDIFIIPSVSHGKRRGGAPTQSKCIYNLLCNKSNAFSDVH